MTKLYAISVGSYSDYRIIAIFDNKQIAEEWMKFYGGEDIEEFTLNPGVAEMRAGQKLYMAWISRDGTCDVGAVNPETVTDDARLYWGRARLRVITWATDDAHAAKIANEKRTQLLALNVWRDDGGFGPVEVAL